MADDGFDKGNHPDDSHSDDNETELISEQSDSGSAEGQSHEPTQELPENNDATQQISAEPDGSQTPYADQQYPQQGDFPNGQYPQDWNQYPQGGNAPEWNPQTGQYDGWNAQYPQQGWEQQTGQQGWVGDPSQQGWDPNQYPQQGWDPNQYPQQGWEQQPSQESWEGQPAQQATEYLPDGSAGLAGATAADRPDVNESIGGIPFSDEPQPKRKSQYWIIAVAAVLVVALGVGLFYFLKPKNDDATKAVPAPASKPAASASHTPTPEVTVTSTSTATASSTASTPAAPKPSVPNNASVTPTPDLVRQLFNAPDAQVQWVSLAADGQNAAVAYAPNFNINGKSAGPNGGHLVMRKNGGHWEPLPQGGVIADDNDCDAMLKVLGDKAAVAASQVMSSKQCDAAIVYDMAKKGSIRLGDMAGVGPLNLDKSTAELAGTIHVIPDGVSGVCTRNTPVYARYNGFLGGVWTSGDDVEAYLFVGGTNASSNGARIGITEAQLRSDYSKLKLTDVTSDFHGMGYEKALAFSSDGKEVDYLFNGGRVVAYMIRNSSFIPTTC
ncbi:hypothetical protein KJZ00_10125 [Cutibacterium avidum]|uniref:hypothetical protein n=1 Tax=Cutibacterium avidum TaxID=33010 RepID=UPI0008F5996E|nr:hypothetical protein [Cutibacterium avidum]MCO6632554.1 hypothetical protein [Cutibacterium avidum]MCO6661089.1 hypothetical protein [Cutibacterium avidum]MCO6665411.1 hypothetical protein [Cutibacterium avidum]MCT1416119.1 hypothetical protein [Cutibacterium avidum]MDQ9082202.1 hypothetical protein [Cutibacterium avidum]